MAEVQRFRSVFTPYGKEVSINAFNSGDKVQISFMGIGDGNGAEYTPEFGQEDLKREWVEIPINNISIDENNPFWLVTEGIIPENIGGNWIREVSIKDSTHRVIAVATVAATYKPVLEEGSATASVIRVVIAVNDTNVFELTVDPSVALVARDEFLRRVEEIERRIIPEAPIDGRIYGRRNGVWQRIVISNAFIDPRDGKNYRTVEMPNGKIWMAENLNYAGSDPLNPIGVYYGSGTTPGNAEPFAKAGRLYTYDEALTVAPPGWHLPSDEEWEELVTAIGGAAGGGTKLKATAGWNMNGAVSGNGTDDYQFTGLPGGYRYTDSTFSNVGNYGHWWSSTATGASNAYYRRLHYTNSDVYRSTYTKAASFSVRCLKD